MKPTDFRLSRSAQVRSVLFCIIGGFSNITTAYSATFPVMIKAMLPSFGGSRTALTLGYSAVMAALALSGPLVGRAVDRYGQRPVILVGILGLAGGLASMCFVPAAAAPYIALSVIIGIFGAATFQFFYYSLLPYWFESGLGVALGLGATGVAAGLSLAPQLADLLVRHFGWRLAYVGLAAGVLAIGVPNLLLLPSRPKTEIPLAGASAVRPDGLEMPQVLRTSAFWKLALCYFIMCAVINGNVVHFVGILADRGVKVVSAARSMAYLGVANFFGRLLSGVMLTRVPARFVGGGLFLAGAAGAALLTVAGTAGTIAVAVVLMGVALGAEGEMLNFMTRQVFGLRAQGSVLGALSTAFLAGVMSGPLLISIYRDQEGSYTPALLAFVLAAVFAALLHVTIRTPTRTGRAS